MQACRDVLKHIYCVGRPARLRRYCGTAEAALFGHEGLSCPSDWQKISQAAISKCNSLVQESRASQPGRHVVHILDEISDTLCHATDAAAFCGAVHADRQWRTAAQQASQRLQGYLAELNTTDVLWHTLQGSMQLAHGLSQQEKYASGWTAEEIKVGDSLLQEFRQAGMALEPHVQEQYRVLAAREQQLIMALFSYETHRYDADAEAVLGIPRALASAYSFKRPHGGAAARPALSVARALDPVAVLADVPVQRWLAGQTKSAAARSVGYSALRSLPAHAQDTLVDLAAVRRDLAHLVGSPSYMHYRLQGAALTQDPADVQASLAALSARCRHAAGEELESLQRSARDSGLIGPGEPLAISDLTIARQQGLDRELQQRGLGGREPGFPVDAALATLFRVVERLFGVHFERVPCSSRESWAPGVQKYRAVSTERGELGTVFLDLYQRPGKQAANAHYTLLCGRRISEQEYRRPIVALACSFPSARDELSVSDVQTLFHEFGHALNSVMCDNALQHMFGARGPLDAVELPSHILEAAVMHGEVLDWLLAAGRADLGASRRERLKQMLLLQEDFCAGVLRLQSLALPRMDWCLHGEAPPATAAGLREAYVAEVNSVLPLPARDGTFPHFSMTHAITYGGLCHAYQYAETLAGQIWQEHLAARFGQEQGGAEVAELLIRPGGALDASLAVERLLPGHRGLLWPPGVQSAGSASTAN